MKKFKLLLSLSVALLFFSMLPQETMAAESTLDTGDTAWILTSTALVLFMTLPGLALFYGGLVRSKNVLSVLMQCQLMFPSLQYFPVWEIIPYILLLKVLVHIICLGPGMEVSNQFRHIKVIG